MISLTLTDTQIKAEAARLFEMAREIEGHPDHKALLYAHWALLSALGEKRALSDFLDIDAERGICGGHGPVEDALGQYRYVQGGADRRVRSCFEERQLRRDQKYRRLDLLDQSHTRTVPSTAQSENPNDSGV